MPKNMKYDEVSAKAGSDKKKGAAESKWLSERGPVDGGPEKAVAKKKGPAQKEKVDGAAKQKWGGNKHDYKRHMDAQGHMTKDGDVDGHYKDYEGPGRMGYTQNFGPARQNGYARGAAKVAKIMGYGAADHIDGHPAETAKQEELKGVTIPGHDKSSEGKMDINEFNKQSQQVGENINAARTSFGRTITSDSLNQVLNVGSGNIHKLDLKRYEEGRETLRNIANYYGNSKKALELYGKHNTAFQDRTGIYSDENLKKK